MKRYEQFSLQTGGVNCRQGESKQRCSSQGDPVKPEVNLQKAGGMKHGKQEHGDSGMRNLWQWKVLAVASFGSGLGHQRTPKEFGKHVFLFQGVTDQKGTVTPLAVSCLTV